MRRRRSRGSGCCDEVIAVRPVLSVHYAGALLLHGLLDGVEARLQDAERWCDTTAEGQERPNALSAERIVVDHEEFRRLPSMIASYRAAQAWPSAMWPPP